jgi:DNA-binding NtrC family response regulator
MSLFLPSERRVVEALAGIAFGNPFLPERIKQEQNALGSDFTDPGKVIQVRAGASFGAMFPNLAKLHRMAESQFEEARQRLAAGSDATEAELSLYQELVDYVLYNRHASLARQPRQVELERPDASKLAACWKAFRHDYAAAFEPASVGPTLGHRPEQMFALFWQIARAFHSIFENLVGGSPLIAALRASVWQSIFTHDMRRYWHGLHRTLLDVPTLITGPSGSGKELVARAVGQSLYAAFDPRSNSFAETRYSALNLSAFAPTLIELELFGSVRGAFSGATERAGWLEQCGCNKSVNAIFLDEIGELREEVQVKLLRVLQERTFCRVGETAVPRVFQAKIIAATNRDLAAAMSDGRFRPDFYYRLSADVITTPALREQLASNPEDLPHLVRYVVNHRVLRSSGPGSDANPSATVEDFVTQAVDWIGRHLGPGYSWPGNFRELEQCVRNLLIRGHYQPVRRDVPDPAGGPLEGFLRAVRDGSLTDGELRGKYLALILKRTGSLAAASKRLGLDARTLKSRLDAAFHSALEASDATGNGSSTG